jgi:outer membrane receptor protein involved in Fe transport
MGFPGGAGIPLNYPVDNVTLGNGEGCATEIPAFNAPCSGTPPDNRLGLYVGDSWKVKPNFTVTYGLRYVRDTGRADSDLPALPALNALLPGLGNRVSQPNLEILLQARRGSVQNLPVWCPYPSGSGPPRRRHSFPWQSGAVCESCLTIMVAIVS